MGFLSIFSSYFFSFITIILWYFNVYKKYLKPLNIILLCLYPKSYSNGEEKWITIYINQIRITCNMASWDPSFFFFFWRNLKIPLDTRRIIFSKIQQDGYVSLELHARTVMPPYRIWWLVLSLMWRLDASSATLYSIII